MAFLYVKNEFEVALSLRMVPKMVEPDTLVREQKSNLN